MASKPGILSHGGTTQSQTMNASDKKGKRKAAAKLQSPAKRTTPRPTRSLGKKSTSADDAGEDLEDPTEDDSERKDDGDPTFVPGKISRKSSPREAIRVRDNGRCVVTGFAITDGAHIIPIAWDDTWAKHAETRELEESLGHFDIPLNKFIKLGTVAFSDGPGNMISLSPNLHRGWGKALFGLKPIAVVPQEVGEDVMGDLIFQFVWLPRGSYKNYASPVELTNEQPDNPESLICKLNGYTRPPGLHITSTRTKTSIESGHLFHIKCPLEEAEKLRDMLAIQWALIRISAMSGAADAIDHGFDPTLDPDWIVLPWLADQVGRTYDPEDLENMPSQTYSDATEESEDVDEPHLAEEQVDTSHHQRTEGREAEGSGDSESA